jgi:carbonic anhydrase
MTSGDDAWARLVAGNRRFVDNDLRHPGRDTARRVTQAAQQTPFAVILGCSDSRVPHEIIFDEGLGDLFSVRVAGNTATDDGVLGSIEFGAAVLGCVLVLVLGHEECGAVTAAVDQATTGRRAAGHIGGVVEPIVPSVAAAQAQDPDDVVHAAVRQNVLHQVQLLQRSEPILAPLVDQQKLSVIGAIYDLHTGAVARVS